MAESLETLDILMLRMVCELTVISECAGEIMVFVFSVREKDFGRIFFRFLGATTLILGRASLTQPLYPVRRVNHDLYTRSEGLILILILIRSLGYLGSGL